MLFHTPYFLFVFLPLALAGYIATKRIGALWGKLWLIAVSMAFYATWRWEYLPLLMVSMTFNFLLAGAIHRVVKPSGRSALLTGGVLANVALLGYFKYKNFFLENLGVVTGWNFQLNEVALPLAISFYTFTQIAYLTDVYRQRDNHRGPLDYCMFIMFFPHLVAGPILRHWEFFPQIRHGLPRIFTRHFFPGLVLLILGIAKKVIFAESAAEMANAVYAVPPENLTFFEAWMGSLAFGLQVYFDFSGYSDMALGLGLFFGIRLPVNFLSPYKATSIIDFWSGWHLTLGRFLRDYIYMPVNRILREHIKFPLTKSNSTLMRAILGVFATMIVSGIWHGAGWTFIVFGLCHGAALAVNHTFRKFFGAPKNRTFAVITGKWALTFVFNLLTWVYFRSTTIHGANSMIQVMLGANGLSLPVHHEGSYGAWLKPLGVTFLQSGVVEIGRFEILWIFFLLAWTVALPNTYELLRKWRPSTEKIASTTRFEFRPTWWLAFFLGVIFFWIVKSFFIAKPSEFVYFQF